MDIDDAAYIRDIVWSLDAIKWVLNGKPHTHIMFAWGRHKFGHHFWKCERDNLLKGEPLSDKARQELERIVIIMGLM